MMAKTHIAFTNSIALSPILYNQTYRDFLMQNNFTLPIVLSGLMIGSLLPDIDEPNSTISRSSFVTFLFSWFLILLGNEHRGITHKLIFVLFFFYLNMKMRML